MVANLHDDIAEGDGLFLVHIPNALTVVLNVWVLGHLAHKLAPRSVVPKVARKRDQVRKKAASSNRTCEVEWTDLVNWSRNVRASRSMPEASERTSSWIPTPKLLPSQVFQAIILFQIIA